MCCYLQLPVEEILRAFFVSVKTNNVASYQSESPMPKSRGLEPHQNTRFGKCLRQAHPVSLPFCYSLYLLKSIQSTAGRLLSP